MVKRVQTLQKCVLIVEFLFSVFQYRYHSDVNIFLKDVIQEMFTSFITKVCFKSFLE